MSAPAGSVAAGGTSSQQLEQVLNEPGVKVQRLVPALWNLDRMDQRGLPLNGQYTYGSSTSSGTGERQAMVKGLRFRV